MKHQRIANSARKPSTPGRKVCRRGAAEWRRWLARYERSGLSLKACGARHGLALSTLTYWRRRERNTAAEQSASFAEVPQSAVSTVPSSMALAGVLIERPGRVRFELSQATDAKWLAVLLRELGTVACSR
ncbi:MAG: hypothetical protein GJU76_07575 [Gallionella sp.]|nr:hypothetical protein [Gallionella sp.]